MNLDIRTTVLSTAALYGTMALVLALFSRRGERAFPGEGLWALGYFFLFAAELLIGLRGLIPGFFSIVVGNTLSLVGMASIAAGTEVFCGLKPSWSLYACLIVASAALAILFSVACPDARVRVIVLNLVGTATLSWGAIRILRGAPRTEGERGVAAGVAVVMFLIGALLLARTCGAAAIEPSDWLKSGWTDALFLIALAAAFMALAFFLRRLVSTRLWKDLDVALADRELLLREMHHRTKNDLALVQSLLSLELLGGPAPPGLAERLSLVGTRVHSIGLVHDMLHSLGAVREVRLDEYLALLAESYSTAEVKRTIATKLAPISIDSGRAISVGLLVNELAMNALRHAFPDGREGRVTITLQMKDHDCILVEVRDDGVGFDPKVKQEGFGSALVEGLAGQLNGSLVRQNLGGTRVALSFPI